LVLRFAKRKCKLSSLRKLRTQAGGHYRKCVLPGSRTHSGSHKFLRFCICRRRQWDWTAKLTHPLNHLLTPYCSIVPSPVLREGREKILSTPVHFCSNDCSHTTKNSALFRFPSELKRKNGISATKNADIKEAYPSSYFQKSLRLRKAIFQKMPAPRNQLKAVCEQSAEFRHPRVPAFFRGR